MPPAHLDARFVVHHEPGVRSRRLDDELVLLDAQRGLYFALNPTGALVWEWIGDAGARNDQLVARLVETFEVSPETAEKDLRALVETLAQQRLVETRAADPED